MTFRQFLAVVEIRTKVVSVSTYTLATLYTVASGGTVRWIDALLLFVAVICVDMGTTAFNSFYDYLRGVDNPLFTMEPDKVILHEGVAPAHALIVSFGCYLVAAATGLVVAAVSSWWILVAGFMGMLVGFLYNGGPLPISRTPLGELFAGGFLGSVLFVVIYGVHAGRVDAQAFVASVPSYLVIAAVLTVNNTCDLEGDRAAGRRTLSIVVGRAGAEALVAVLVATAYLVLFAMAGADAMGLPPVVPRLPPGAFPATAVGAAVSAAALRRMHRRGYRHETKSGNMSAIIRVMALYTVAYSFSLVLAALGR